MQPGLKTTQYTLGHTHSCPATVTLLWSGYHALYLLPTFIPRPLQITLYWDCPRSLQSMKYSQGPLIALEHEWRPFTICSVDMFSFCHLLCTSCAECFAQESLAGFFLTFRPQGDLPGHPISITPSPPVILHCSSWFVLFKSLITLRNYSFICFLNLSIFPG